MVDQPAGAILALARAGDLKGAIAAGEAALAGGRADPALAMFVGMLCCRDGDLARGIPHLRRSVELAPREVGTRVELARALLASGAIEEAGEVAAPLAEVASPVGREMQRIHAHVLARQQQTVAAAELFEQLTRADPNDFESWDGLGVALVANGHSDRAVDAHRRATTLRPTAVAYRANLARAYAASGDFGAAVEAAALAVRHDPQDGAAQLELGRAHAALGRFTEALAALAVARTAAAGNAEILVQVGDIAFNCKAPDAAALSYGDALQARPDFAPAMLGQARVLERLNQTDALLAYLDTIEATGVSAEETALLRACGYRNQGRLQEALELARAAANGVELAARSQLIGDLSDRLGDTDAAFAAFTEANDELAAAAVDSAEAAAKYLDAFRRLRALLTGAWHRRWRPALPTDRRPAPLFIFGFPRSGTTLIDTMLSGHPDAVVLEEEPAIDRVAEALGPVEALETLSPADIDRLRRVYFAEIDRIAPGTGDRLIVDKHPLALGNTPLLHRLFPDARFVFVERHPCDVVLSCFITSSRMDSKVASFFSFKGTALLYDQVLAFWQQCVEILPIRVHTIRYEALVADPEGELRRLAAFAGLAWTPQLLDNTGNAGTRSYIGSPSYSQVAEPIYTRARGRWLRYRRHMAEVIPILRPWVERMGYDLGELDDAAI